MRSNTTVLKTIRLGGALGQRFGRVHRLAVESPAEAIRALTANYPAFRQHLEESDRDGVGYRVKIGRDDLPSIDNLHAPSGQLEIRIIPVIRGAKSGLFEVITGIALIAASFIPGAPIVLGGGVTLASLSFSVGVALTLGGVSQLLAPHPKTPASTQASYLFGGPVNTLAAGMPVPICYGNLIVGGAVISGGITVDQVPTTETGVSGLVATVTLNAGQYELYASWQPAGDTIAYDVTIQGGGIGPVNLARTNGTSIYYTVPGEGPYEVIVNPVLSSSTSTIAEQAGTNYGPGASIWSSYVGS
ncbi:tail assembly protein [Acidocella facilis]|uniref:tail assembly protein n=1 Tax=Acidocella facilis TaxID=525 RepID=UPI001F449120|nr:hypothetical protein [Acidocella facilis]